MISLAPRDLISTAEAPIEVPVVITSSTITTRLPDRSNSVLISNFTLHRRSSPRIFFCGCLECDTSKDLYSAPSSVATLRARVAE